ncbi:hypothetical protein PybrP1_011469 [[Pythium] brassicae (nom. inval.)]|nr:hypothetical protein PybrP1_011469 [[Pythium] brassicae (nom. inval.)]
MQPATFQHHKMDAFQASHKEEEAKGEEATSATQRDTAIEAQFLARFDALALLEAEYAAVLAQSRPAPDIHDSDNDSDCDSEGEVGDRHDNGESTSAYAVLPTSPTSSSGSGSADDRAESDFYQRLDDDSDGEVTSELERKDDRYKRDECKSEVSAERKLGSPQPLKTATRTAIMQSMQGLALAPPPWAKDVSLSDDDLIAMVLHRMQR